MDMVVNPHALVESSSRLRLHSIYYITKQVSVLLYCLRHLSDACCCKLQSLSALSSALPTVHAAACLVESADIFVSYLTVVCSEGQLLCYTGHR